MHKQLLAILTVLALLGCDAGASYKKDEQKIEGPFPLSDDWLLVTPEKPLVINREGVQGLHLMFDPELYQPNHLFIDEPCDNPRYLFALRDQNEELLTPEVVLITEDGEEVALTPTSHLAPYTGGISIGFGLFAGMYELPPEFPEHIDQFVSFRVRSNRPAEVDYFWWSVDRHPDMFR